jgi:microcin C transport system substrate-binding protein
MRSGLAYRWWRLVLPVALALGTAARAQTFPRPGWTNRPDPVASPYAEVGGEVSEFASQYPKSLNYYLDNNFFSAQLFGALYETLLDLNSQTLEYEPAIARQWTISKDKRTFTFEIDPRARWSDGKPITAADVRFTFDTIMNPKNLTGPHKVALERFEAPEVLGPMTIRFQAKQVHWQNLGAVGGMQILPKHEMAGKDFNNINFAFPVVSGPYRLAELKDGLYAIMERRADWWRRDWPSVQGIGNIQRLRYRFFASRENAFEAFKKGQIDVFAIYTARLWVKGTDSTPFYRNWIVKQNVVNRKPVGFQGFAMNLRHPPFDDIRVRKAMAHLVDRRTMNETLMYNQYFLHRSYYEDLYGPEHPCPNKLMEFDMAEARRLLKEAGWRANPKTGLLEKDGKPLAFTFLTRSPSSNKFLQIFDKALKDVGIQMTIDQKDWSAWAKDMDDFSFDMTWAAWGAGLFKNPEGMWASKEADRQGGTNITGFKDPRVDALIEKQKTEFDVLKRHAMCRQIDQIVYSECPYVLLWNTSSTRLLYWNKFGTPPTVLGKYSNESVDYWWYDEEDAADLAEAMADDEALPKRRPVVVYDKMFQPPTPPAVPPTR